MREKESATFQCEVPVPSTETAWFKEETKLRQSKKYNIEEEGTYRRLTVQNVTTDDDAVYICEMKEGSRTIAELSVQGKKGSRSFRPSKSHVPSVRFTHETPDSTLWMAFTPHTCAVKNSSLPYSVRGEPRVVGQWVAGSPARVCLGRRVREQGQIVLLPKIRLLVGTYASRGFLEGEVLEQ